MSQELELGVPNGKEWKIYRAPPPYVFWLNSIDNIHNLSSLLIQSNNPRKTSMVEAVL